MSRRSRRKPLVVVAGQVPPPTGGQNIMIRRIIDELSEDKRWTTLHLPFRFTASFQSVRRFRWQKILELIQVWIRFLALVARHGRPDVALYPSGGPQTVPVVRDIFLLPLFCALSHRVIIQFHAAGIAERLRERSGLLERALKQACHRIRAAIVMTAYNKRDPGSLGIADIAILPHLLSDHNPQRCLPAYPSARNFRILYAGHLYEMKGTPQLVEAFGEIAVEHPSARLVLMGEFLPPYSERECRKRCKELGVADRVEITGVLQGKQKHAQYREAHLMIFPSIAPYESFGLVLVEAMMWGLPVLATDWRGNRDVAGPEAVYVPVGENLHRGIAEGLRQMLASPARLVNISIAMRNRFETNFRLEAGKTPYRDFVARVLADPSASI